MNRLTILALTLILTVLISCKTGRDGKSKPEENQLPKAELVSDFEPYSNSDECSILDVAVTENIMTLKVQYSGGCEKHEFKLIGSEMILKSFPPQRGIVLWHDNKGDSCRSIEEVELKFDISVFSYEGGEIMLNLQGWNEQISYTATK